MDKVRENRLRRMADRQGLRLSKSRSRDVRALDFDLYALTDVHTGGLVHSDNVNSIFALSLDEVEEWLTGDDDDDDEEDSDE